MDATAATQPDDTGTTRSTLGEHWPVDEYWLISDANLVPFCDMDRGDPWGWQYKTNAKVQLCEQTCAFLRSNDPSKSCPWMNTPQHVYLLVGMLDSETYLQKGEKKWKDILTTEQMEVMESDRELVLGYVVGEKLGSTVRIHWIYSFVPRVGVMKKILTSIQRGVIDEDATRWFPVDTTNTPQYIQDIWAKYAIVDPDNPEADPCYSVAF